MKTRRVFTAFNQSAVFQEGVRAFLSRSSMRLEDVASASCRKTAPSMPPSTLISTTRGWGWQKPTGRRRQATTSVALLRSQSYLLQTKFCYFICFFCYLFLTCFVLLIKYELLLKYAFKECYAWLKFFFQIRIICIIYWSIMHVQEVLSNSHSMLNIKRITFWTYGLCNTVSWRKMDNLSASYSHY